jgi:hypothetical protein
MMPAIKILNASLADMDQKNFDQNKKTRNKVCNLDGTVKEKHGYVKTAANTATACLAKVEEVQAVLFRAKTVRQDISGWLPFKFNKEIEQFFTVRKDTKSERVALLDRREGLLDTFLHKSKPVETR